MNMTPFEENRQVSEFGREYWTAREFCSILQYKEYRNFLKVVKKAKESCLNSGHELKNHFVPFTDMVPIGSGALRKRENLKLSRYACYLIVQNANPNKEIVAQGQSYFAEQTRKQEILQDPQYREDQLRVESRRELTDHQRELFSTAKKAGVRNYGSFQNAGYEGMYGGLKKTDLNKKKGLKKNDNVFDYMSSEELGANLFRTTQTEAKLKRELEQGHDIGQKRADTIHFQVGDKVRATIHELGGTMPENLPAVEHIDIAIKRLESLGITQGSTAAPDPKILTEKFHQKKEVPTYDVPSTLPNILALSEIIKTHPGSESLKVGDKIYKTSEQGLLKIKEFYTILPG